MATEGILGIAQIPVRAVLDQLDGDLAKAKSKTEGGIAGIARNVQKLGGLALAGIGAGVVAIGAGAVVVIRALGGMVQEAMEAEAVQAALNAVLTSTGGIAGVTAKQANDLADSLSKITRFDDEAIISGESLLLTFTNIGKNVFPKATDMMLNMSTVLGQDLPASARMLGRALNDPVAGMSALTRVGITFSDEQKNTIKALQEAGELEKAQGIILDALTVKFGGAAAAAGQTFGGQMDILKNRLGNVREEIGGALLPVAGRLMDWFGQAVDQALLVIIPLFEQMATAITNVVMAIEPLVQGLVAALGGDTTALVEGFYQAVTNLFGAETTAKIQGFIGGIMGVVDAVKPWIEMAMAWIGQNVQIKDVLIALGIAIAAFVLPALWGIVAAAAPVIATAIALIAAVALLRQAWESDFLGIRTSLTAFWENTARPALTQLWEWLKINIPMAINWLKNAWVTVLLPAIQAVATWITGTLVPVLLNIYNWLATNLPLAIQTVTDFWNNTLLPAIQAVAAWITGTLVPVLLNIYNWLATNLPLAIQTLTDFWNNTLLPAIQAVWGFINAYLVPLFMAVANVLSAVVGVAITALAGLWQNVLQPALEKIWGFIDQNILPILEKIGSWIWDKVKPALDWLGEKLGGLASGALQEIKKAIQWVIDKLNIFAETLRNIHLPDWLIPGSPTPFEMGLRGIRGEMARINSLGAIGFESLISLDAHTLQGGAGGQTVQFYGPVTIPGVRDGPGLLEQLLAMA